MTQQTTKAVSMEAEVDRGFPPWPVRTLLIWLGMFLLLSALISALAGISFGLVSIRWHLDLTLGDKITLGDLVLQALFLSGVFLFISSRVKRAGFSLRHLWGDHKTKSGYLGICLLLGALLASLAALASYVITGHIVPPPVNLISLDWRLLLGAELLVNAFMVGVVEEIYFRGLLYRTLRRHTSVGRAILTSGILFGVYHPELIVAPVRLLFVFFCGLIAALLFERTRSLSTCISFHVSFNIVAYTMYYLVYYAPAQS